jgi:hypothetical protein
MSRAVITTQIEPTETVLALTTLVDRARGILDSARGAAAILDARDMASVAYDASKTAARLGKAKRAHDDLISAIYRTQADALEIESLAKRRLADEYDAAQERGEIRENGERSFSSPEKLSGPGILPPKELHEARLIRDAEKVDPGIVRRTVDAAIAAGEEPSKAKVRRAVLETVHSQSPARPAPVRGRDAICERVREAVIVLSGLPPAHEVVGYFAGTDMAIIVSERIRAFAAWVAEFSDLWEEKTNAEEPLTVGGG